PPALPASPTRRSSDLQYPYRLPLIVEAVGVVDDPFRASVIVSVADAQRIRRELQKYDFLGRWAVVFIIGDDVKNRRARPGIGTADRKSTRLNSSHVKI